MKNVCLFTVMLSILFASCNLFDSEKGKPTPVPFPENLEMEAKSAITSNNEFGFDLYQKLYQDDSPDNMMLSPISISLALAMTYNGAEGETKTAFENTLQLADLSRDQINIIYQNLQNYLEKTDSKVQMNIANSVWSKEGANVEVDFKNKIEEFYNAEFRAEDFSNPATLTAINNWVAQNTEGKIQNILENIPSDAFMYLINAIYFKGEWTNSFDTKDTYEGEFTDEQGGISQVYYMTAEMGIKHFSNDLFEAIELPYGNKDYAMVILLPNESKKVNDIIDELNSSNWTKWMNSFSALNLNVHLPKFKFGYKKELSSTLTDLGMGNAFSEAADFSGISKDVPLRISKVIHQSFIEVNEKGTEAAAATVVEILETSIAIPSAIHINRPFFFAIKEKQTNSIVFMGSVKNP